MNAAESFIFLQGQHAEARKTLAEYQKRAVLPLMLICMPTVAYVWPSIISFRDELSLWSVMKAAIGLPIYALLCWLVVVIAMNAIWPSYRTESTKASKLSGELSDLQFSLNKTFFGSRKEFTGMFESYNNGLISTHFHRKPALVNSSGQIVKFNSEDIEPTPADSFVHRYAQGMLQRLEIAEASYRPPGAQAIANFQFACDELRKTTRKCLGYLALALAAGPIGYLLAYAIAKRAGISQAELNNMKPVFVLIGSWGPVTFMLGWKKSKLAAKFQARHLKVRAIKEEFVDQIAGEFRQDVRVIFPGDESDSLINLSPVIYYVDQGTATVLRSGEQWPNAFAALASIWRDTEPRPS